MKWMFPFLHTKDSSHKIRFSSYKLQAVSYRLWASNKYTQKIRQTKFSTI
jgi:hypothetical protein